MPRLPQPGSDQGTWGDVLNDFLLASHTADGSLKDNSVGSAQLTSDAIAAAQDGLLSTSDAASTYLPLSQKGASSGVASLDGSGKIPTSQLPANDVTSVAGKTGAVTLAPGDIVKQTAGNRLVGSVAAGTGVGYGELAFTESANQYTIPFRDIAGRAKFADPSAAQDAATKNYVDTASPVLSVAGKTGTVTLEPADLIRTSGGFSKTLVGATQGQPYSQVDVTTSATGNAVVRRDASARAQFADPSAAQDAATKNYVDTASPVLSVAGKGGTVTLTPGDIVKQWAGTNQRSLVVSGPPGTPYGEVAAGSTATGVSVVMRDSNSRSQFADPVAAQDAATKASSELTGDRTPSASLGTVSGTLDLSSYTRSSTVRATLTGNITTITLPTPTAAESYTLTLVLTQDATGSRTVAWGSILAAYGVKPVLSTAANSVDIVHLFWTGAAWVAAMGMQAVA